MAREAVFAYVIKTKIRDAKRDLFTFTAQKTMYGGRRIGPGDVIYLIASENSAGPGLIARGKVVSVRPTPRNPALERQTPRVSITVNRLAKIRKRLGRAELKPFGKWGDGRPETELNFKLYRQATDKIVGITAATVAFLARHF